MNINRGDIWIVDLEPTIGSEMKKRRPIVVINTDAINSIPKFNLRIVVPLTSFREKYDKGWFIKIYPGNRSGLKVPSIVDPYQIRCISDKRFERKLGRVTASQMEQIEEQLLVVLDMDYLVD